MFSFCPCPYKYINKNIPNVPHYVTQTFLSVFSYVLVLTLNKSSSPFVPFVYSSSVPSVVNSSYHKGHKDLAQSSQCICKKSFISSPFFIPCPYRSCTLLRVLCVKSPSCPLWLILLTKYHCPFPVDETSPLRRF